MAGGPPLTAWSHGNHPAAAALARGEPRVRAGARPVGDAPADLAARCPRSRSRRAMTVRSYRDSDAADVASRSTRRPSRDHPEQGAMDADNLAAPDGRAVVRPGRAARGRGRRPGCSASTGPSSTTPALGEVYVVGVAPGRAGARARQACSPSPGCTTSPAAGSTRCCSTSSPTTPRRVAVYSRLGFDARGRRHARDVRPLSAQSVAGGQVVALSSATNTCRPLGRRCASTRSSTSVSEPSRRRAGTLTGPASSGARPVEK